MAGYRQTWAYTKNLVKQELFSVKTAAVYIFMLALCGCVFSPISSWIMDSGDSIGYWEMADCMLGSYTTQLFYLLGVLVLVSGIPYAGKEIPYYLIRGNKTDWVTSNVLLLILHTILYYVFVCMFVAISILPGIRMENQWSELYDGCKNGMDIGNAWLYFSDQSYNATTSFACFAVLLIEAVLCSVLLGMIVFLFSMYGKRRIGILFCVVLFGINSLLDYGLDQFSFFGFIKYINPVSFLSQYWLGEESISGTFLYALRDLQQEFEGRIFFTSIRHASLCTYIKQLLLKTGKRAVGMGSINCVWFIVACTIQANVCGHLNWINWEHMAKASVLYILGLLFFSVIMFWIFVFSQSLYWVLGSQIVLFSMLIFITYMPDWGARVLPICWTSLVYSSEMWKEGYPILGIILLEVFLMSGICFYGTYRCRKRKLKVLR